MASAQSIRKPGAAEIAEKQEKKDTKLLNTHKLPVSKYGLLDKKVIRLHAYRDRRCMFEHVTYIV